MRKTINWNEDWRFFKGEKAEADKWEKVTLPHTWNAYDPSKNRSNNRETNNPV